MWKWIKSLFSRKKETKKKITSKVRMSREVYTKFPKPYSKMNRRERREYERWLDKNGMWDGEIVIKRLTRSRKLDVK